MTINIETPMTPPQWALLERQLLKAAGFDAEIERLRREIDADKV